MNALDILKAKSAARQPRNPEQLLELIQVEAIDITASEAVKLKLYLSEHGVKTPYYEHPSDLVDSIRALFLS